MNIKKSKQQRSSISPCRTFDSSKQIEATSEEEFKSIFEKVSSSCFCISGDGEGSNHGADGGNRGGGSDDDRGGDGGNLGRDRCDINEELYDKAWKQFDTVSQRCILEGKKSAWIACSIYSSMWQSVASDENHLKYFNIHLLKLIKICNISVLEFFEKVVKWMDIINANRRLQETISKVQSSLAVVAVVFKKFLPIFRSLFEISSFDEKGGINNKQIFQLNWILFIALRKQFVNEDLMNNFHLLLCCVDYIFHDLIKTGNAKLLKRDFVKHVENDVSSLEFFCHSFGGVVLDSKHFRVHCFLPRMRKLMADGVISTNSDLSHFTTNISSNLCKLSELYEEEMGKRGEMDERIFIPSDLNSIFDEAFDGSAIERLRRTESDDGWEFDAELLLRMSTQSCLERLSEQRHQRTPLSGNSYIIAGDQYCPVTPVSGSLYNATKMDILLNGGFKFEGSHIEQIMLQCRENPTAFISNCVRLLGDKFENAVAAEKKSKGADFDSSFTEMISLRRLNTDTLFYRFLEKIAISEGERTHSSDRCDLSNVLNKHELIASIYACAVQLILFTYDSEREFPWCLEVLRLSPVHFYKVIELVIRADPELSREMVKHLNRVEERILEELAWSLDSPLWQALARRADGVPSSQSVSLNTIEGYSARHQNAYGLSRYNSSPLKIRKGLATKRRFDYDDDVQGPSHKHIAVEQEFGAALTPTTLFFRKVYYLAAIRLNDICERVRLDEKSRQRVWTLFEHVLRTETSLMAGRHLDQNLMCCLYVISKIGKQDISFHDIMYHYRQQPQACSRVYRRVLIDHSPSPTVTSDDNTSRDSVGSNSCGKFRSQSTLPVPGNTSNASSTPEPQNHDYEDLIKYYNRIFVNRVEYFVKKLQPGLLDNKECEISLLPMPTIRCHTLSPRRVITDRVTVLPMSPLPSSPARPVRYSFNRSPTKPLISPVPHSIVRPVSYQIGTIPSAYR